MFNTNWNKKIEVKATEQKQTFPKPKVVAEKVFVKPTPKAEKSIAEAKPQPIGEPKKLTTELLKEPVVVTKPKLSEELLGKIERRNLAILRFILDQKYVTRDQLTERFFGWSSEKREVYAGSAVKRLLFEELIKERPGSVKSPALLIVTEKGLQRLNSRSQKERRSSLLTTRIFEPEVMHDLLLNDVRIRMEGSGKVKMWMSEKRMGVEPRFQELFKDMPDALVYSSEKRGAFLEYENSPKNPGHYKSRIEEMMKVLSEKDIIGQQIDEVVFVCGDIRAFEMIEKIRAGNERVRVMKITEVMG